MAELAPKTENTADKIKIESGHETRMTDTDHGHGHGFEPEILAFCCEH
jgi:hypothetical protein